MSHLKNLFLYRLSAIADIAAFILAALVAAKISGIFTTGFSLRYMLSLRLSVGNAIGGMLLIGIWLLIFRSQGLYAPKYVGNRIGELKAIIVASGVATVIYAAIGLFFRVSLFNAMYFAVFWPTVVGITVLLRRLLIEVIGRFHLGDYNRRNIVIIGTNESAWSYAKKIDSQANSAYHLLGFLDDFVMISDSREQYLGQLEKFETLLETHVVDEIVIAMPIRSCSESIQGVIDHAHERGIAVRFPMSQVFSGLTRNDVWRVRQEASLGSDGDFSNDLVVYSGHEFGGRYLVKRVFDIVFASTVLVLTSPIMVLATLAIYAGSGRPAIFVQDRYGYNGRVFKLFKFRTMVNNADALQEKLRARNERDGAAFKMKNDPRVTPVGRFLRKTSIDELPQLINVIRGEMSMVGPRPLPLADYRRMNNTSHRRRLSVLPGITGPWQISGRDHISFEEWMEMDLDYIDNWRLWTDLKIILLTVPVVVLARGAK
jgi:exopolysaccharide biosynthesis polyprenyl glycosylphosphotransferase